MGEAALEVAQPVVIKAIPKPGVIFVVAHVLKKEWEQNFVDLLGRGRNGIATLLFALLDNQANTDFQSNSQVDKDISAVVIVEAAR